MASLTKAFIDDVPAPEAGYKIHWHDTVKGFGLRVTENGRKTFVAQGRVRGLPVCVTLGAYGVYTPKTAEDVARKLLQQMREGVDPREARRRAQRPEVPTLRQLADEYMARPGKLKARSKEQCVFRLMPGPSSGASRARIPVHAGPPFRSMPGRGV